MGALISRWKAKPTTVEQLEKIDKEIKELEEFRAKNQRLQKLWVGRLLLYSSVLYLLTSLIVYCLYLPEQWLHRIAMALPFFVYPVLVWFIRKLLVFLFSKRTERNNDKLEDLKASKKKIELESTPVRPQMTPRPGQEIRQRGVPMKPMPMGTPAAMAMTPVGARPPLGPGGTPVAPGGPPERSALSASVLHGPVPRTPCSPIPGVDRGVMDRVIEYLVGDGPQNRYALICQQCFSHNGMALKEEFEYLAFRCAYCYFMNPARKTRPQAPRLPEFSYERRLRAESRSPGPTPRSGADRESSAPPSGATMAPAPWNLVHSFQIQQSPKNPQNRPLQSPDERDLAEDEGLTNDVEGESQSEEQPQQQQVEEEEEGGGGGGGGGEEEVVQKEEEEEMETEPSHSAPCETEPQPS
ncbi:Endoplasmic reticulum junction formation protein lunapark-B [Larimichthys crocea]|uniref:Uncharacterized protein n=1 Tax=Larimichthys crocea TaxID=215358 RepID=A0ACD3QAN7_LARCR|nr:Endoplasmic reticulum junction formation protein lunapark-B [Larimichthys crocea]